MRIVLGLTLCFGGIAFLMYTFGGVDSFDPEKQYQDALTAVKPGMTWRQVITAVKPPKKYRPLEKRVTTVGEMSFETFVPMARNGFVEESLADKLADGYLEYGFWFEYMFTAKYGLIVQFDGTGTVIMVQPVDGIGW
jgi:hypothetical protein